MSRVVPITGAPFPNKATSMMSVGKAESAVNFVLDMLSHPERFASQPDMGDIHSALAPALEEWTEECNGTRDILMVAPVGSVNYDLLTEDSDLDMKAVYMPNLSDFYNTSFPQFNFVTDAFDCQLSAAHKYIQFVLKGSMNHFEAIFSPTCKARPDFAYIIQAFLKPMVEMNVVANIRAAWFMALKAHDDAIKNGWKPKKAANAIRIFLFLISYVDEGKITYVPTGVMRNVVMRLKTGNMGQEEYEPLFAVMYETVVGMCFDHYEGRGDYRIAKTLYDRDRTETPEWAEMKQEMDHEMMKFVVESYSREK